MADKPTYEEIEQRVKELEKEALGLRKVERDLRIFKTAVESSINAIGITDLKGKMIYVNDSCVKMWGYNSKDEILGRFLPEFWAGDGILKTIRELHEKGVASGEDVGKRKDGSLFFVQFTASVFKDEAGNPSFMFGSFFDITERKQVERDLKENQRMLEESQCLAHLGSWEWSIDTNANTWSDEMFRIFGYEPGAIVPNYDVFSKALHSNDRERVLESVQKSIEKDLPYVEDYRIIRPDVSERIVHATGTVHRDEQGRALRMVGTVLDITDLKHTEEALRESEERFRELAELLPETIFEMDANGLITFANRNAFEFFGYTQDDFDKGVTALQMLIPEDRDKAANNIQNRLKGAELESQEYTALRKDGGTFPISINSTPVIRDNTPMGLRGIIIDITDRKQAEEGLEKAKKDAEAANKELTEANSHLEKAIEQAKQMAVEAEVANIAKSEFLANMSHEIRTPMNGVIGMTSLLLGTELSAEQREYTEIIRSSGDSLLSLINDILDYSKIEAGKLDLENIDFDLRVALDELTDFVAIKAQEKGLEYIAMVSPDVPSLLFGDPGRLRQILINLVSNATKFTEKGEVIVKATLEDENTTHATIRFSVTDTGIGIPKDRIDRLFKSFSQADSSTTRKFGGTGLGLTISKQLAELMGGQIGVESEEGKGSTFWFTAVFEKQPEDRKEKIAVPNDIKGKRILIVDDNATNRYVLREQLNLWGCRHGEASSGMKALEELRLAIDSKDLYEIAILDMQMPEMDGETLGQKIKQDPDLKKTTLVLLTSMGKRGDAKRIEEIGFGAYLTKPVKQSQFYDCLTTVTSTKKEILKDQPATIVTRHSIAEDKKHKQRILLVEDNITNQKVALNILKRFGYSADAASNGKEAVMALEMIPYDIVLMDCQMPVMDGYEATGEIRNPESKVLDHKVPIIALTAHAMKGNREKCLEAGMDDYLSKPLNPQALSDILEKWLVKQDSSLQEEATVLNIASEKDVLDKASLLDRVMGDEELAKEILGGFLKDVPRKYTALKESFDNGDAHSLQSLAHTLKGASSNVGALALQEVAHQIEAAADSGNMDKAGSLIPKIEEQLEMLKKWS